MLDRRDFLFSALAVAPAWGAERSSGDWRFYGGDSGASRYSPLDHVKRGNVGKLKVAWSHKCGDAMQRPATTIECTPIVIDGVMYLTTARLQVRALKAATGEPVWNYNPLQRLAASDRREPGRYVV